MDPVFVAGGFASLAVVYTVYRRCAGISLADIPGPKPASFLLGNMQELYQGQAGEADIKWQAQYGNVVRFKGSFGEDQLMISDPAALQYILGKAGYRFPKPHDRRVLSKILNGKGVTWAMDEDHKRHRKVMIPGFGVSECKALLPSFMNCADSMSNKWIDIINSSNESSVVLDIPTWLGRATLDAIGQAAFDVHFGCIDNNQSALARTYTGMMTDIFGSPPDGQLLFQGISRHIPYWILEYFGDRSKNPRMVRMHKVGNLATSVAKDMLRNKAEMLLQGKDNRDVFSLLVKANMDSDAKTKLTEEELIGQMRTILFAGHDTTSNTLTWALFELTRHPEMQTRLRAEIREMEASVQARGDTEFTTSDFDDMPYLNAILKEVLRFSPVAYQVYRWASQDDVVPLSKPITTRSGKVIDELHIPKSTRIVVSIAAYNRNKDLWGEDADVFNPERWLDGTATEKKATSLGVYSNLLTFLGGVRGCIGWRFAVTESQAFLTEMVGKFQFAPTEKSERVRREACLVMAPTVVGEIEKGVQLPLRVSVAPRTENEY